MPSRVPVLSLCDTPGNMVGPEAERIALVRHGCRLYVVGANLAVPVFSVVLRKAYGLGAQGMVGGRFHLPLFSVAWPTGEFGPMNLEDAVKLGFRKELEVIADPVERKAKFDEMVVAAHERGKALSTATMFEIDDVIDPAQTRSWVMAGLRSLPPTEPRTGKKRAWVDTWKAIAWRVCAAVVATLPTELPLVSIGSLESVAGRVRSHH